MFESWYSASKEDEQPTRFWLQFQVVSDGFEDAGLSSAYYQEVVSDASTNYQFVIPTQPAVCGPEKTPEEQTLPPQEENDNPKDESLTTKEEEQTAQETAPARFHLFTQLPAELRLKIWSCLIRPRIILAACLSSRPSTYKPLYRKISQRPKRRYIPVLLHVCSESRAFALEHYELTFPWKTPHRLRVSLPSSSSTPKANVHSSSRATSSAVPSHIDNTDESGYHPARVYFNFALDTLFLLGELEPSDGHGLNAPMVYFLRQQDTARVKHVACAFEGFHLGVYDTDLIFGSLFHILDRFPSAKGVLPPGTIAEQQQGPPIISEQQPGYDETSSSETEQAQHPADTLTRKKKKKKEDMSKQQQHQFLIITTTQADASTMPQSRHQQQQSWSLLGSIPTTNNVIQKIWRAWAMGSGYWPGSGGGVEPTDEGAIGAQISSLANAQMVMLLEEELAGFVARIE